MVGQASACGASRPSKWMKWRIVVFLETAVNGGDAPGRFGIKLLLPRTVIGRIEQ